MGFHWDNPSPIPGFVKSSCVLVLCDRARCFFSVFKILLLVCHLGHCRWVGLARYDKRMLEESDPRISD